MANKLVYLSTFIMLVFTSLVDANTKTPISLNTNLKPWTALGILENKSKKCTAAIIGKYELLASAYCIFDDDTQKPSEAKDLEFSAGYSHDGYLLYKSKIISYIMPKMVYPPQNINQMKNAWVVLLLDNPAVNTTGYIPINKAPVTSEYLKNHKIILAGYNNKFKSFASQSCKLNKEAIDFNDTNTNKNSPFLLQVCDDTFEPLLGSLAIAINNQTKFMEIVGVYAATLTQKNKKTKKKTIVNLIVPASSVKLDNVSTQ